MKSSLQIKSMKASIRAWIRSKSINPAYRMKVEKIMKISNLTQR